METSACEAVTAVWRLGTVGSRTVLSGTLTPPNASYWLIELVVFALAAVCIRHAVRSGRQASPRTWRPLFTMLMVVVFTFAVEFQLSAVSANSIYCYPEAWLLMFLGVPIWIPLGWGWIVYVCMSTSDKLNMPWAVAPWLDGFLALTLDFLLDPIADHYGWWVWTPTESYSLYFQIPLSNFMAWFVIVASFSLFVRYLNVKWFPAGRHGLIGDLMAPLLAMPLAFAAVALYKSVSVQLVLMEANGPIIATVIWGIFLWVIVRRAYRFNRDNTLDPVLFYVPISFYGLLLLLLFAKLLPEDARTYNDYAELALFMPITAALGCLMFAWPYMSELLRKHAGKTD